MTVRWTTVDAVTAASKDHSGLSARVRQDISSSTTPRPVTTSTSAWSQVSAASNAIMREELSAATAHMVTSWSLMVAPAKLQVSYKDNMSVIWGQTFLNEMLFRNQMFSVSTDRSLAVLLVAKRSQIIANKVNFRPPQMRPVVSGSSIVTVDFDRATSRIYWADASQKKIWSSFQNGTDKKQVRWK